MSEDIKFKYSEYVDKISVPQWVNTVTANLYDLTISATSTTGPGTLGLAVNISDGKNSSNVGSYCKCEDCDFYDVYDLCIDSLEKNINNINWIDSDNIPLEELRDLCKRVIDEVEERSYGDESCELDNYTDEIFNMKKRYGWYLCLNEIVEGE